MENTVAFSTLMELIRVVGAFVDAPIFFNLSVLNILVISFLFNMIIGILLGGIAPRAFVHNSERAQVVQSEVNPFDKLKGVKESYTGGGSY